MPGRTGRAYSRRMAPRPARARSNVSAAALVRAQKVVESFDLARDGSVAVLARRQVHGNAYRSHLWVVPTRGGRPRRLTSGAVRDTEPQLSPDGAHVAFLRAASVQPGSDGDETAQVWIVPVQGGRPWRLTRLPHGVASHCWSPDGRFLALVAEAGEPRFVVGPQRAGMEPVARHVTRTDWRNDDTGLVGRRFHLWVIEARRGAQPRQLTSGDFDVGGPAWSPDGHWIAFEADREPDWNIRYRYRIFRVSPTGGPVRELVSLRGDATAPAYSPDGRHLAFIGSDVDDPTVSEPERVWVCTAGGARVRCLSPGPRPRDRRLGMGRPGHGRGHRDAHLAGRRARAGRGGQPGTRAPLPIQPGRDAPHPDGRSRRARGRQHGPGGRWPGGDERGP